MVRPRILVADDHTAMRERIATLLGSTFDVVATVANGQAAVEATRTLLPDLVVLVELVSAVQRALTIHAVYFYEDAGALSRTVARP